MLLNETIRGLLRRIWRVEESRPQFHRGPVDHVVVLDGTMSSLDEGWETNAGLTFKLLAESPRLSLHYEAGVQWPDWRTTMDVVEGRGINRMIRRAYGFLASRYRPGDRIFLFGYSRGGYAVRSLAGAIDRVGLLKAEHATVRMIRQAYRHYEISPDTEAARVFAQKFCHPAIEIEMIGCWDTVKALGLRVPFLWQLTEPRYAFHNHALGASTKHGYHALALDETREAFQPVMWQTTPETAGRVEQVWFRGSHGDVGGQLSGKQAARPLANIPLVWMLGKAEALGLALPPGWRGRFRQDAEAPGIGTLHGWGKLFLARRRRLVGRDPSERVHPTAQDRAPGLAVADVGGDAGAALETI